jgi:uncharacterized small protein (DUF1192 family)
VKKSAADHVRSLDGASTFGQSNKLRDLAASAARMQFLPRKIGRDFVRLVYENDYSSHKFASPSAFGTRFASHPITARLLCTFARAQAVSPAPDGGYPNGTTAEGTNALFSLTTGVWNTALGFEALNNDTAGKINTATGVRALLSDTTGSNNTAIGVYALYANINGWYNNAIGAYSLANNISGNYNTANGYAALYRNTTGIGNTAAGSAALYRNTTGFNNTANGGFALFDNIAGSGNTADGASALGSSNTTGNQNTAIGLGALVNNTFGNNNTAIGYQALVDNTSGSDNTALGFAAGNGVITANNVICIGASGANVSGSCFIGNIRGVTTANAAIPVLIDTVGQLGTASSSRRFKKEIRPMDKVSDAILALKPVTFHYKTDKSGTPQFGLVAEEVAEVNPDLVVRDENGEIYTVRYDAVNAMLLNEFLKEHRAVQELKEEIAALTAGIQKVSAQLEATKPTPQVVNNP